MVRMLLGQPVVAADPQPVALQLVLMDPTRMEEMHLPVVEMAEMEVMEISPAEQVGQLPVEAEVELKGVSFAVPPMVGMVPMAGSSLLTYRLLM